ncbi:MAG: thiamine diphosphokinase [Balneolales bacterium]|nr:thiamine diphosphokinase [Balneolales bacterium]
MHALIIGNGNPPGVALFERERNQADLVVAADGGGNWCMKNGFKPDIVVGDLDSFNSRLYPTIPVLLDLDQETNDLEKALRYVIDRKIRSATLLGVTGERLDHTLKNISVMAQFERKFDNLSMKDEHGWMKILPRDFSFEVAAGTIISLFPVSGVVDGIYTTGLEFALHDESLENGRRDGSSNRSISDTVTISHRTGKLLLMVFDSVKEGG